MMNQSKDATDTAELIAGTLCEQAHRDTDPEAWGAVFTDVLTRWSSGQTFANVPSGFRSVRAYRELHACLQLLGYDVEQYACGGCKRGIGCFRVEPSAVVGMLVRQSRRRRVDLADSTERGGVWAAAVAAAQRARGPGAFFGLSRSRASSILKERYTPDGLDWYGTYAQSCLLLELERYDARCMQLRGIEPRTDAERREDAGLTLQPRAVAEGWR